MKPRPRLPRVKNFQQGKFKRTPIAKCSDTGYLHHILATWHVGGNSLTDIAVLKAVRARFIELEGHNRVTSIAKKKIENAIWKAAGIPPTPKGAGMKKIKPKGGVNIFLAKRGFHSPPKRGILS